ncbi:MAG: hypothetical protein LBQ23_01420 [Puniceicoccales bacterium]|jgi:hypothetical protein|nr:hypothetical protein [Puniceicoccales bacterium]
MSIQSIHYVRQSTFLESGKQIFGCDLHFHSTGEFSFTRQNKDGVPEMINGILPTEQFYEFNELINREVFYAKMPQLFGENVITQRTKRVEALLLQCFYENPEQNKEAHLLFDADPFNTNPQAEKEGQMLTKMLSGMSNFVLQRIVYPK